MPIFTLLINGKKQDVNVEADTPLLWVLRDTLGLKGTKYGCGVSDCGACTVHLNNQAVRSCVLPVSSVKEAKVTTIEGLTENGTHPLQQAWIEHQVPQCGYCQAGQLMTAAALLARKKKPTTKDIDQAMQGNLCRCGTYGRIRKAILAASKMMK